MHHPLHPALVHIPVASWTLAVVADVAGIWFGMAAWQIAVALLAAGCLMALPAMLAGLVDFARIVAPTKLRDAYLHMGLMLLASTIFMLRLVLGLEQWQVRPPSQLSLTLDVAGLACLTVGGYMGGRLVYKHGVGVQHSADQREQNT